MKLVHAGNVRIGSEGPAFEGLSVDLKSVYANDLQELIRNCEKQQTDLLLFSGNLFDHRPSEEELKALDEDLSVLTHTRVFIVPGLSDSAGENDAYWTHEWKSRVMVFLGDSLQRVHVPEMNAEITCCGYNENTWPKVRPEKLQRGRKGQFQILLLPFLGENDSKEALETYVSRYASDLKFDYVAVGNAVTKRGEGGIPVYSARSMEQDRFEEEVTAGVFEATLTNEKKAGNMLQAQLVPPTVNHLNVLRIKLDPGRTTAEVEQEIRERIAAIGKEQVYQLVLEGEPSASVYYLWEAFRECGNIAGIIDETENVPATVSENTALKRFAQEMSKLPNSKVRTAAMKRGIEALIAEQERAK